MKTTKHIFRLLFILFLTSCGNTIEKFNEEKPYAIEIAKERSFYQAEKLTNRLIDLEEKAYMIQYADSLKNDGKWYYILCDNFDVLDSAKSKRKALEEQLNLEDLKIVTFDKFKNAVFKLNDIKDKEEEKIASSKPNINNDVFDVIKKFPESNALFVEKTFILNSPSNPEDLNGYSVPFKFKTDLPRGISKKLMLQKTTAFSEVIYKDNLYNDRVTIDIGKLRKDKPLVLQASFANSSFDNKNFEIAEEYANLILDTGDYLFEEKKKIEINASLNLSGYKVTIEPRKNYFRTYIILVDKSKKYVVFSQSTDKTEEELIKILSDIGKGDGLLDFNEIYNTFYTIPESIIDNDKFIGFTIDKLDWSYAKDRNYSKWSSKMIGHWQATGYFLNTKKGVWAYSIFDLLTTDNQNYIYGNLYSTKKGKNKYEINVYGTDGYIKYTGYKSRKKTGEINFGINRYVCAIVNTRKSWFTKDELLERAESLQFKKK